MTIQWFPGHMAKARREVTEKLPFVDIVFELVDARLPLSSRNPMLDEIIQDKPRLILLNKSDLADFRETVAWQNYFEEKGLASLAINSQKGQGINKIIPTSKEILAEKIKRNQERGLKEQAIKAMILGIPNVGKSTLLNRLVRRNIAQTGNKPGVTKGQQWLKVNSQLELLDTPGILWPKFEDQEIGKKLAVTGAIKDQLLHMDDLALYAMEFLAEFYPDRVAERYQLTATEKQLSTVDQLLLITEKRGYRDDYERASLMIVQELRKGLLGPYTLDRVKEMEAADV